MFLRIEKTNNKFGIEWTTTFYCKKIISDNTDREANCLFCFVPNSKFLTTSIEVSMAHPTKNLTVLRTRKFEPHWQNHMVIHIRVDVHVHAHLHKKPMLPNKHGL